MILGDLRVTAADLADMLFVSKKTVERGLQKLTDEDVVEYFGSVKEGCWKVKR